MKEDPKHIRISEFNYPLPDERIAKFPLPVRDQSKLLLYRHGEVTEDIFTSLPDYLPANSLMIFNNTKVIQARLHFHKETPTSLRKRTLSPIFIISILFFYNHYPEDVSEPWQTYDSGILFYLSQS